MHGKVAFRPVGVDSRHHLQLRALVGVRRPQASWVLTRRGENPLEPLHQSLHASGHRRCVHRNCSKRRGHKHPDGLHLRLIQFRNRRRCSQRFGLCWHLERPPLQRLHTRRPRHGSGNSVLRRSHQSPYSGFRPPLHRQYSGQRSSASQFPPTCLPCPGRTSRRLRPPVQAHQFLPLAEPDTKSAGHRP